jgi:hypothetical protein
LIWIKKSSIGKNIVVMLLTREVTMPRPRMPSLLVAAVVPVVLVFFAAHDIFGREPLPTDINIQAALDKAYGLKEGANTDYIPALAPVNPTPPPETRVSPRMAKGAEPCLS